MGVRRPIICICNELFTPSLRPLRKVALVVPFPPTLASRLASRLKEITMMEKLNADLTALLALCKKSDNDIRSCLSTLQFFKKQCKSLRSADVAKVNVGSKDSHKSALKVLDDIFAIPNGELNRLETAALTRQMEPRTESTEEPAGELWVEKYKPRSYIDLLSDDGTNRILLMWLKLWGKLVFNKERKVKPKKEEEVNKPKYPSALPDVEEEFDSLGRPVQTVALLHGPPGLGKTTLAHIVAKHAGYKVVEMNA